MKVFKNIFEQINRLDGKWGKIIINFLIISIFLIPILVWLLIVEVSGSNDLYIEENLKNTTEEVITVTIDDFIKAYNENAMRADAKYKGKIIKLTGEIARISSSYASHKYSNAYHLILQDNIIQNKLKQDINIFFSKDESLKLYDLNIGQKVTIVGRYIDYESWRGFIIIDAYFEEIVIDNIEEDSNEIKMIII